MIDTHCHLLPGVDDGPATLPEALELARGLTDAGFRTVVCTPHFSRRFPTDHELARDRLHLLREALAQADVPLQIGLAAEISSAAAVDAPLADLRLRRLGNGHLLVELEPDTPAGLVEIAQRRLGEIGLTPVFAHPERCRAVRSQPHILDAARASGALVQVVATSLGGSWGNKTAGAAWMLLATERVDLLASDAHHARQAGGRLVQSLEMLSTRLGDQALFELTQTNPGRLVGRRSTAGSARRG